MSFQYRIFCDEKASSKMLAKALAERLHVCVLPVLVILAAYLDNRLVGTFLDLLSTIVEVRHREQGLVLTELGASLLSPDRTPAGVKRISRLLHSPKWVAQLSGQFLFRQAEQHLQTLEEHGEAALCVWDGSEIEKPESQKVEGLWQVALQQRQPSQSQEPRLFQSGGAQADFGAGHPLGSGGLDGHAGPAARGGDALVDDAWAPCQFEPQRGGEVVGQTGAGLGTTRHSSL